MEQSIYIAKSFTKRKAKTKFKPSSELCFQNVYQQIKPQFEKKIKKYERDGTSLNMNKGRSGRRITTRTREKI